MFMLWAELVVFGLRGEPDMVLTVVFRKMLNLHKKIPF